MARAKLSVLLRVILNNSDVHRPGIQERVTDKPPYQFPTYPVVLEAKHIMGSWEALLEAVNHGLDKGVDAAVTKFGGVKRGE